MVTKSIFGLLDNKQKDIVINPSMMNYFSLWKEMYETYEDPTVLDGFIAGYMIANNITVKERFLKIIRNKRLIEKEFK